MTDLIDVPARARAGMKHDGNDMTETASGIRSRRVLRGDGMCTPLRPVTFDGVRLVPGRSLVVVSHEWVQRNPELWRPYWSRDREVLRSLARALEARMAARGHRSSARRPSWRLPTRRNEGRPAWQL